MKHRFIDRNGRESWHWADRDQWALAGPGMEPATEFKPNTTAEIDFDIYEVAYTRQWFAYFEGGFRAPPRTLARWSEYHETTDTIDRHKAWDIEAYYRDVEPRRLALWRACRGLPTEEKSAWV